MTRLYFHCASERGTLIDRNGLDFGDLREACERADSFVRSLIASPNLEDWRGWVLHVSDDRGEDLFVVPFASALNKPH